MTRLDSLQSHMNSNITTSNNSTTNNNSSEGQTFNLTVNGQRVFTWGSILNHPVPENFEIPLCSVKELCDQWHFTYYHDIHGQLQPLKNIIPKRDLSKGKNRTRFSKAKKVVDYIWRVGEEDLMLVEPTTLLEHDAFFASAYNEVCNRFKLVRYANSRQIDSISYMTVYKDIIEIKDIDFDDDVEADRFSNGF